ncbi:DUF6119 family protein [Peribacillus frigoritolerans]|uniref:DUF6119 family protein n=1 Tax=Peribacillus frigoritolerans TaxID=450367 RepID=UPI00380354D6
MREIKHKFAIYKINDVVSCTKNLKENGFEEIECKDPKYRLYTTKKVKKPKWERILLQVAEDPTKIKASNETSSFVLLRSIGANAYAFTGGIGFFSIQNYIVQDFGIDLISKIIDPDRIKYIKQKPLAGKTVQEEHIFKEYYNYEFDPNNWGKISKEILGEIKDTDLKTDLGIDISGKFKIRLQGKSSFTINRSLTLDQLDTVLERLEEFSNKEDKFRLYKGFSEVKNSDRKNSLSEILIQNLISLYKGYRDKKYDTVESNIIISYADVREFILSDYYVLSYKTDSITLNELSLEHIFDFLIDLGIEEFDESYLSMVKIAGYDNEDEMRYMDKLKVFLVADVLKEKTNYCYIDQKWFEVSKDLIEIANEEVCKVLENYIVDDFKLPHWKHDSEKLETEDSYIPGICSGNLVQMHRNHIYIKGHDKAEVCDIVDLRKDEALFIFVKKGLGTTLRELFAQARNSMELYYKDGQFRSDSLKKIKDKTTQNFDENKVGVILAFTDHILKRDTLLVEKISTVVKLDLIQTFSFLDGMGIKNIMIYEIPHA